MGFYEYFNESFFADEYCNGSKNDPISVEQEFLAENKTSRQKYYVRMFNKSVLSYNQSVN